MFNIYSLHCFERINKRSERTKSLQRYDKKRKYASKANIIFKIYSFIDYSIL